MTESQVQATIGCNFCRDNHYKCERARPDADCKRCLRAKRKCVRKDRLRIRLHSFPAEEGRRRWLPLPRVVDFVDETAQTIQEYKEEFSRQASLPQQTSPAKETHQDHNPTSEQDVSLAWPTPPSTDLPAKISDLRRTASSPYVGFRAFDPVRELQQPSEPLPLKSAPSSINDGAGIYSYSSPTSSRVQSSTFDVDAPDSSVFSSVICWPLTSPLEASLIRNFVDKVSHFFDFCDKRRRFALDVPQHARTNYTLSRAMFALSARHLSLISEFDTYIANQYQQQCLESLIPLLDEPDTLADEALLAALVILRLLEELDVSIAGSDKHEHLLGTQAIIAAQKHHIMSSGLREAAFWAALRQELYVSTTTHRPPRLRIEAAALDSTFANADDWDWSRWTIAHCCEVLDFAFGPQSNSTARFEEVMADNKRWNTAKPSTFDPYYQNNEVNLFEMFPDVRYQSAWHVMGVQYHLLAHLLLIIHNPNIPSVGPARRSALQKVDAAVRSDICRMSGIGYSNSHTPAAMIVACLGIALCGDRFPNRQDQEKLHDVQIYTEKTIGWPTSTIRAQLRETWEWNA
ncbi:hypothetical protein NA57DRAFT_75437 [Rhizodiscina lignyota]|uniref:Zn(2)-C6 fungal-type domain-containing protein n=1 Tax=Rhizodiscina lignyota TaxID=1504668 RepID=A0A9P4IE57_9PEZI|nr:hypothetical protein NA57DRAFT_75437 [Rhizodiscina lignyota]